MKIDAHCQVGESWDTILQQDCEDNWIVVPRRYWLDAPSWYIKDKPYNDAISLQYPFLLRPYQPQLTGRPDWVRQERDKDKLLVEDMSFQGSCWFMTKAHFNRIGGVDPGLYGTFGAEPEEIGLKTQLGPWAGSVMRNKKTWYAHWSKPMSHWRADPEEAGRITDEEFAAARLICYDHWFNNRWEERVHDFEWLVDKFWPVASWPDNWRWEYPQFNRYEVTVPERI